MEPKNKSPPQKIARHKKLLGILTATMLVASIGTSVLATQIGYCPYGFGSNYVIKKSSESMQTLKQLESYVAFVERDIAKDDMHYEYEEVFYGMTLDKELGIGFKLYRNIKDENRYSIILAYSDSCFTADRTKDKMYFSEPHWAGESVEDVVKHFENGNMEENRGIQNQARYCEFYSKKPIQFYVGVPFIKDDKRQLLIYGIQETNENGRKVFVGYGNGEVSLQQSGINSSK